MKDKDLNYSFSFNLDQKERLELEMIVLDRDDKSAFSFIKKHALNINKVESLKYCSQWLKTIKKAEEGKLKIKLSDKGPGINI